MNSEIEAKEMIDRDLNQSIGDLGKALGRYDMYEKTDKQDRGGVYAVGGVGALFILGGLVTLGRGRN